MKKFLILFLIIIFTINSFCFADDFIENEFETLPTLEVNSNISKEPQIFSKHAIVIDRATLSILYDKSAFDKAPMASTTKIMTCILALENSNLDKIVTITQNASSVHGSKLGLKTNMKISMNDLLYGLMLRSGNDCAIAIAEEISGSVSNFANLMNKKANELSMYNTNFVTPHGLDNGNHYTTAYDLAILTNYALNNDIFKKIVSTKNYTLNFGDSQLDINNTHELLGNFPGIYGVKTGFTFNAGRCLVSAYKNSNLDIIIIILGADTKHIRTEDTCKLINYINNNFQNINVSNIINDSFSNFNTYIKKYIILQKTSDIPNFYLQKLDNYNFPLKNDNIKLHTKIYSLTNFSYNNFPNEQIGVLYLYNDQTLICESKIFLSNTLSKNTWKYYFLIILKKAFKEIP